MGHVFLSHLWEKEEWEQKKMEGGKKGIEKERKEGSRNKERSVGRKEGNLTKIKTTE